MKITHPLPFLLFFSLFFLTITISAAASSRQRCHPDDYKALVQIKKSLHNPYHLASWQPNTDCCTWYCLRCNDNTNRVYELTIFSGNISGRIPVAVGDLPYLETLHFRKLTDITGSIPRSVTKLKSLTTLTLSWLNLTGPLPDFLTQLTHLKYLDLSFNQFSGSIPRTYSKFTNLEDLHLDRNKLTGTIPESFGHFSGSVPNLYLSHNLLTGPIPKSFANMNWKTIDLSRNNLDGDASMLFKSNGSTFSIDLSRNMFEFDLSKVKFPVKVLAWLDLNHNRIRGNIPKEIVKVQDLQLLNVSYNRLCGEIPSGGNMGRFTAFEFEHNACLCGSPLKKCK